ncbi:non-syndromic hearing impairment protein 5 homolog isoform X2 [Stegastes partitus]|uniref:Non-syndromic hearing impairment protein 5 homolog isoform X2 n=1 Tax=Stegastes partitus TaxID=144197 RepID=A0A9Y4TXE7_9TELE|nr:PREDICTED: non-syndromic hearing impairment protein 5 homolog isoform X2 [Stegastes partitus]
MFSKATANFIHQIDPEGSLIHVSRVNDSHKLTPMALVVKRNRIWFWQTPKYQPTDFTLSDLLQGDEVLIPGVTEKDFLSYDGSFGDALSTELDTEAGPLHVKLKGQGISKLQSSFGKLKKEELDVKKLLHDSDNRLVNMDHVLVQQLQKRADVLAVVKERILTTKSCSVTQTKKEQCMLQGVLGLVGLLGKSVKVCVKDSNNIELDSDVSLEIPSGTVIAYSILELEIKKNGEYDICLQPGTIGGFEADTPFLCEDSLHVVDGERNGHKAPMKAPPINLQNGSQEMDLLPLAELPQSTRRAFIEKLRKTLRDRADLSYLQGVLEELCSRETLDVDKEEGLPESPRASVSALLEQPGSDSDTENGQCGNSAPLKAACLLVSAMEELPDETLRLLSESHPDFLEAFDTLVS